MPLRPKRFGGADGAVQSGRACVLALSLFW